MKHLSTLSEHSTWTLVLTNGYPGMVLLSPSGMIVSPNVHEREEPRIILEEAAKAAVRDRISLDHDLNIAV